MEFFHGHRKKEGNNELTKMKANLSFERSTSVSPNSAIDI